MIFRFEKFSIFNFDGPFDLTINIADQYGVSSPEVLRNKFIQNNIDGYIIPKNDKFFSENVYYDRLKIISGFNFAGSYRAGARKSLGKSFGL